jgi:hypothetical protein
MRVTWLEDSPFAMGEFIADEPMLGAGSEKCVSGKITKD